MGLKSVISAVSLLVLAIGSQPATAGITLVLVDAKNNPLAGVTCSQNGGASATSDPSGTLSLAISTSIHDAPMKADLNFSQSQIPLAYGEKARITVTNTNGMVVMNKTISQGERAAFNQKDNGIYFVNITAPHYSMRGRLTNLAGLGKETVFESVKEGAQVLAKTAGGPGAAITCSKSGYPSQVYMVQDGAKLTIDFSKLSLVPLFDEATVQQEPIIEETPNALIVRWDDRARDRHAREDEFHIYDHYLSHYWMHRSASFEFIDYVAKGGDHIDVKMTTQWELNPGTEEFRAFYRGIGTVAEYIYAPHMKLVPGTKMNYTNTIDAFYELGPNLRDPIRRPLKIGDKIEMEISQFLAKVSTSGVPLEARANYYGTVVLYVVGKGFVPFETKGVFKDLTTEREDSHPMAETGWLGGRTTLSYNYSNEPMNHFIQMAGNMSPTNGQIFLLGRRVHHTDMLTGVHDEGDNPLFDEMVGKAGPNYANSACIACHVNNGRGLPPAVGTIPNNYIFKVGDANGNPHPKLGGVLQPKSVSGTPEGIVTLTGWIENNGLRKPNFTFSGAATPDKYSVRITPQLVGMGLLEAIPEAAIQAMADPDDADGDGISGRMRVVTDYAKGVPQLGRFGWKAGKPTVLTQVAGAFNTDMGVMSSIFPNPDCGSAQTNCGAAGSEIADSSLHHLADYISLLGVSARRDLADPTALQGEALFTSMGCTACHTPTLTTSKYAEKSELRSQVIHPYTDLLLHDMGPGLADNLNEGDATGAEWRTAPLWNVGLTAGVSGGEGYLHDGRARTLAEAILWHDGEGAKARDAFKALPTASQDAVVKFLKSL